MLIDTHTHLGDERLYPHAGEIISQFHDNNIECAIEIGCDLDSSIRAVELANKYDNIYAVVGLHPSDGVVTSDEKYAKLVELSQNSKVVAIGEIGFDYYYDTDKDIQRGIFERMLELAKIAGKPVVLHIRDAYGEIDNYKEQLKALNVPLLFHCYSGSKEKTAELVRYFGDRAYFAFGGVITFKNFKKQDVLRATPLDRILTETDSPYMSPTPHRGEDNTPLNICYVASEMAKILSMDESELIEITSANAKRFFGIR